MAHFEWNLMQKIPILNDQADMRPILNGNLSIHSIHIKPKKDPFPSKLCSHMTSRMNPSQTPGILIQLAGTLHNLVAMETAFNIHYLLQKYTKIH